MGSEILGRDVSKTVSNAPFVTREARSEAAMVNRCRHGGVETLASPMFQYGRELHCQFVRDFVVRMGLIVKKSAGFILPVRGKTSFHLTRRRVG